MMKPIKLMTGLFLLIILFPCNIWAQEKAGKIKTIILDAGHGGNDPGALGSKSKEKDVTLDVVLRTGSLIKQYFPDVNVIYTRNKDVFVNLIDRAQIANNNHADLFISVHCNSTSNASVSGSETFVMGLSKSAANLETAKKENAAILLESNYMENYNGFNPNNDEDYIAMTLFQSASIGQSLQMAQKVQQQLTGTLCKRNNRGVKQAGFLVLYKVSLPSILVELGFLSNLNEEKYLMSDDGKQNLAQALFTAFKEYKNDFESNNSNVMPIEPQVVVETNSNKTDIIYYIQIAASKKAMKVKSFNNLTGVIEKYYNGNYIYLIDKSFSEEQVKKNLSSVKNKGYKDAFIVAFIGEKRYSLKEIEAMGR